MIRFAASLLASLALSACASDAPDAVKTAPASVANVAPRIIQSDFFRPESLGDTRIKGVRHIAKTVSNIGATLKFYQAAVPFELVERYRIPASELFHAEMMASPYREIDVALVRTPTVFVMLIDFEPEADAEPYAKPVYGPGYTHICFQSPATDPALARFEAVGLEMVSRNAPVDLGGYGVTYAYGRDPDGTMIENETVDRPRRTDAAWITHIGGATSDVDRMVEFYTGIIGYGARRRGEYANFSRMDDIAGIDGLVLRSSWFVLQNLELEFWEYVEPATPVRNEPAKVDQIGYSMTAFEVTDVAAEAERLQKLGIKLAGPPIESRGWKIVYAHDPDGNVIAFQENVSAAKSHSIDAMLWIDPTTY